MKIDFQIIAFLATKSLVEELYLTPKPGLVDLVNTGSHKDLNLKNMILSAKTLEPFFEKISKISHTYKTPNLELRKKIGEIGRNAEIEMLKVTSNINTHKGAIWALGLTTSAVSLDNVKTIKDLQFNIREIALIQDPFLNSLERNDTNGDKVFKKYGIQGAKENAQSGFSLVFDKALPMLLNYKDNIFKLSFKEKHDLYLDVFLTISSELNDTCILSRSGVETLSYFQKTCKDILNLNYKDKLIKLKALDEYMIDKNASAGGVADMFALTIFIYSLVTSLNLK